MFHRGDAALQVACGGCKSRLFHLIITCSVMATTTEFDSVDLGSIPGRLTNFIAMYPNWQRTPTKNRSVAGSSPAIATIS